jgi:hypothetical protein
VENDDIDDYDADDIVPVPQPTFKGSMSPPFFIPLYHPEPTFQQELKPSDFSPFRRDTDGVDIFKFSDIYIGGVAPFIEGLVVPKQVVKVSVATEGTSWYTAGDEVTFLDPRSGDIRSIDIHHLFCQPKIDSSIFL